MGHLKLSKIKRYREILSDVLNKAKSFF